MIWRFYGIDYLPCGGHSLHEVQAVELAVSLSTLGAAASRQTGRRGSTLIIQSVAGYVCKVLIVTELACLAVRMLNS